MKYCGLKINFYNVVQQEKISELKFFPAEPQYSVKATSSESKRWFLFLTIL